MSVAPVAQLSPDLPDGGDPAVGAVPSMAWGPILAVVAVKLLVNGAVSARYGWQRDELYYADAGRHLSAGYVDFPPVTPLIAALARGLFADSLVGLRFLASLAGAGVILVTAILCRDLGGGRRAQLLAAIAITPLVLGSNAMFQTVSFDQLTWALVLWATLSLLRSRRNRAWLVLAAAAALAWQTKFTVGVLFVGLFLGFIATRAGRSLVRRPVVVLGGVALFGVAALAHPVASWHFLVGRPDAVDDPPLMYLAELCFTVGFVSLPLAGRGIVALWRDQATRALAIALGFVPAAWLLVAGKGYYAAPFAVGAFAAGAASLDHAGSRWSTYRRILPALVIVTATLASPLIVPVLPRRLAVSSGVVDIRDDYAAELGWPEMARQMASIVRSLPAGQRADTVIVAGNYGVAGALVRFGPSRGLKAPVISGHLSWGYWSLPVAATGDRNALAVGVGAGPAPSWCGHPRQVGRTRGRPHVDTGEKDWPIWSCRLSEPVRDLRNQIRHN